MRFVCMYVCVSTNQGLGAISGRSTCLVSMVYLGSPWASCNSQPLNLLGQLGAFPATMGSVHFVAPQFASLS